MTTTASTDPVLTGSGQTEPDPEHGACAVCEHDLDHHDAISRRFCQASQSRALTRHCICPPAV